METITARQVYGIWKSGFQIFTIAWKQLVSLGTGPKVNGIFGFGISFGPELKTWFSVVD